MSVFDRRERSGMKVSIDSVSHACRADNKSIVSVSVRVVIEGGRERRLETEVIPVAFELSVAHSSLHVAPEPTF